MSTPRNSSARLLGCLPITLIVCIAAIPAFAAPPLPGAVFTTSSGCTQVNGNIYPSKDAVFLDGGPQSQPGAAGLADGYYYVQVTTPDGTVLGSSVTTTTANTPVHVTNGVFDQCYELDMIVYTASSVFATLGYDDTTNPGGEYKVWVSNDKTFVNNSTKTDNFKVLTNGGQNPPPDTFTISGKKFYDAGLNGDPNQPGIQGWIVSIYVPQGDPVPAGFTSYSTTTDALGNFSFANLQPGTYGICELLPSATPTWIPTFPTPIAPGTPASYTNSIVSTNATGDNFGNVCLGAGGGLTLGFWSNKNGQNLITGSDLCLLTGLHLVNASGGAFDPVGASYCPTPNSTQISAGKTALASWLLKATATNMAYMLSAQLTAMELNVAHGFVPGGSLVYAPSDPDANAAGLVSITTLMADAEASLTSNPLTNTAGTARTYQEGLKNALDSANNNLNFVQTNACAVNYTAQDVSCAP